MNRKPQQLRAGQQKGGLSGARPSGQKTWEAATRHTRPSTKLVRKARAQINRSGTSKQPRNVKELKKKGAALLITIKHSLRVGNGRGKIL